MIAIYIDFLPQDVIYSLSRRPSGAGNTGNMALKTMVDFLFVLQSSWLILVAERLQSHDIFRRLRVLYLGNILYGIHNHCQMLSSEDSTGEQ